MRVIHNFNTNWLFSPEKLPMTESDEKFIPITLPHTNKIFAHHNINNQDYQFISTYRKRFDYSPENDSDLVFLDFDGVMLACQVYLNGTLITEHLGGFSPFSANLTPFINHGENLLTVIVDSREREDVPPFGGLVDYLTFGGIYRDVKLRIVPQTFIEDVFITTDTVLNHPSVTCEVEISQYLPGQTLQAVLKDQHDHTVTSRTTPVEDHSIQIKMDQLEGINLWSLDQPTLYSMTLSLINNSETIDATTTRFGFRTAEFRSDGGFYLNGEKIKLFGLNRHQTYPYIGPAAPARLQRLDAEILKFELGCNIVRTSHYPQSPHFLDRCDEIGLLVFEELAGWHHIGDDNWQNISLNNMKSMIMRDRNHPSIILWGVRINESADDDVFYTQTNALAHRLDPTRQTGGVRDFLESNFLEDVYTFNDFAENLREPVHTPHLVTEFAGHMFPTKVWDHEERLIAHALKHANIHNQQFGHPKIAGGIGWCAFDYATHQEFGSGDRICYHGVMDIFRLPKWAAYFYKSQQSPTKNIVLQAATHWTMGDRSGGGNNPLTVFSNCDEVEVIIGDAQIGRFKPDYANYPHLPHPPFMIDGLEAFNPWEGMQFYDLHLVGYLNNKRVIEQRIPADRLPKKLKLTTDTRQLYADGSDMTRLIFKVTDACGNPLPYVTKIIQFTIDGPAELIGENPYPLFGGQGALFVRAQTQTGKVVIQARAADLPVEQVEIEII
ncbi:MAG: glycoside hydrolase family 2 protein [Brevefilum sp.]|jgi:beta-galactosidase